MVYNSYQMERRPIVLKPDWFRPILAPAASVPQRYFDFADKLSTEYLNLRPERCGLKLEFGTLDEADRPHIGTLTNLVVQALNYKRQPAHRIDMPASATHDELEQRIRASGCDMSPGKCAFVLALADCHPGGIPTAASVHSPGPLIQQHNNVTRFYSIEVAWYLKNIDSL